MTVTANGHLLLNNKIDVDATKGWYGFDDRGFIRRGGPGGIVRIRMERKKDTVEFKVNNVDVGSYPVSIAAGDFHTVKLVLVGNINPRFTTGKARRRCARSAWCR